jgi:hypothetical protein
MTEKRVGEGGRGGRASEAGVKVALFGGSGFLGNYVSANLGECAAYALLLYVSKRKHSCETRRAITGKFKMNLRMVC